MLRAVRPVAPVSRLIRFARTAEHLMTPDPAAVKFDATVREAAAFLTGRGLASAPVVNAHGQPVGPVSRTDIVRHVGRTATSLRAVEEFFRVDDLVSWSSADRPTPIVPDVPGEAGVREIMNRRIHRVPRTAPAARVIEELLGRRVGCLLVVDEEGRLIGTVGAPDVLRNLRR